MLRAIQDALQKRKSNLVRQADQQADLYKKVGQALEQALPTLQIFHDYQYEVDSQKRVLMCRGVNKVVAGEIATRRRAIQEHLAACGVPFLDISVG